MKLHTMMLAALIMALMTCGNLSGQDREKKETPVPSHRIPGLAGRHLNALGKRMNSVGREKTAYTGQLFDRNNNATTVRITQDLFGPVQLEGFRGRDDKLSFNGKRIKDNAGRKAEEDLMEIFVMDNAEGMMEAMRSGAAVQFFGSGIGPDPESEPDYKGPLYDVYEVTAAVRFREGNPQRTRLYFFDSQTGLLSRTRYTNYSVNPPEEHETRYTAWGEIDGSKYPARIEHYVDGKLQFDFIAEDIKNDKSADKSEY